MKYDIAIIGGGPAGVMCAIEASKNNKVLLIEKQDNLLTKLLASGGSRCNVSNTLEKSKFIDNINNGKFFYSTMNNMDNADVVKWFESQGVELKIENTKYFPSNDKSKTIASCLTKNLRDVDVETGVTVKSIDGDLIKTTKTTYSAKKIVIATGGNTYRALGGNDFALDFAKENNHKITSTFPANAPLLFKERHGLEGVSLQNVKINNNYGDIIFTRKGISGPGIFELTQTKKPPTKLVIGVGSVDLETLKKVCNTSNKTILNTITEYGPKRYFADLLGPLAEKIANTASKADLDTIYSVINGHTFNVSNWGDYDKAFTMGGGVRTDQINPRTFESKVTPNLYFIGECLDYNVATGGNNIALCLSMGYTCGMNI